MRRGFILYCLFFATICSCKFSQWRHIEILSPDESQVITIITEGNSRYIMNGQHKSIPNTEFALVDISFVDPIGDEIGVCWNKDGFKWQLISANAKFISSSLSSSYKVFDKLDVDKNEIPTFERYTRNNCSSIMIREKIVYPEHSSKLKYR